MISNAYAGEVVPLNSEDNDGIDHVGCPGKKVGRMKLFPEAIMDASIAIVSCGIDSFESSSYSSRVIDTFRGYAWNKNNEQLRL